jgi:phosphoglycerate dehydrogenase-like enzyme
MELRMSDVKPLVLLKPAPQLRDRIFNRETFARLTSKFTVVDFESDPSESRFAKLLPQAFAIVGQPDLPADALGRATRLKALVNVEGNFFPNVDYPTAFRQGVRVLGCGPAYSQAVAEFALGLALDLARGITRADRAARHRAERYVSAGNQDAVLLRHANVGFVGFGNLGRSLLRLLQPFSPTIRAYDPWLPVATLEDLDILPATLEETLSRSEFVFVLATVTAESSSLLDATMLELLPSGARLVLVSRAAVVDYDALLERLMTGRLFAGIDVWPIEPLPQNSPFRELDNVIISPHAAGGIPAAFSSIGEMVCDDLELIAAGLPPVRMQVAAAELVGRYRNRPVS